MNIAPIITVGGLTQVFNIFEKLMPDVAEVFIGESLNKRVGTTGLKIGQVAIEAAKRNISTARLITIPETQGLQYTTIKPRDGEAYVCSSYIVAVFKAAGLFGDMYIDATEFTPRDMYELNFFDNQFKSTNVNCLSADPGQPFCQLLGKHRMAFPRLGTVAPYSHMNEKCVMLAPEYKRQEGC